MMIHSFVVHLVVNELVGDDLIGVVEDVSMADRHHFRTADGLIAHLLTRTATRHVQARRDDPTEDVAVSPPVA
jgi:hypothetical protein